LPIVDEEIPYVPFFEKPSKEVRETLKVKKYIAFSGVGLSICLLGLTCFYSSFFPKNKLQSTVTLNEIPQTHIAISIQEPIEIEPQLEVATVEPADEPLVAMVEPDNQVDDFIFEVAPEFYDEEESETVLIPCSTDDASSQFSTIQMALLSLQENRRRSLQDATVAIQKCLEEHAKKPQVHFEDNLINYVNRYQSLDECYTSELLSFIDANLAEFASNDEQRQKFCALLEEMNLEKVNEHLGLYAKSDKLRSQLQEVVSSIDSAASFNDLLTAVQKSKETVARVQESSIVANMLHLEDVTAEIQQKGNQKLDLFLFDPESHLKLDNFGKDNRILLDLIAYFLELEPEYKVRCVNQFELLCHMNLLEKEKPLVETHIAESIEKCPPNLEKNVSMMPYLPRIVQFPSSFMN